MVGLCNLDLAKEPDPTLKSNLLGVHGPNAKTRPGGFAWHFKVVLQGLGHRAR